METPIYGNIYHQCIPNVSINLPYIRILWGCSRDALPLWRFQWDLQKNTAAHMRLTAKPLVISQSYGKSPILSQFTYYIAVVIFSI